MRISITPILIIVLFSAPSYAITDQERSVLQRLNTELESITKIIDEAEQAVNFNDRRLVDYPSLRADLQKIQQGILDAVNAKRREPRSLPPIEGEYR